MAAAQDVFVDRERELRALEQFWELPTAQCIPVIGRRRVGKTFLVEHFAAGRRVVYYRCHHAGTGEQLPLLGATLANTADDPVLRADPPGNWAAIFALIERLTRDGRLLLVLDEVPYWAARDESLPSRLQNWWDERGRYLDLMLLPCGSAVEMMERLLTGEAPLAGCVTGRIPVRPFDYRTAAELLSFPDPVDTLTAYGILGGVPLYLTLFQSGLSIRDNVARAIAAPTARLYVEPHTVFAAHHASFDAPQALATLRAIARGKHRWSEIADQVGVTSTNLGRVMEPLTGDLALVQRVLPVTEIRETRTYRTQYHLTDNFFRFWFRFIEPNQGHIEFGNTEQVVDTIMVELSGYMGLTFEAMCQDWTRLASAAGALPERVGAVGTWWSPNHQVDVVGLNADREVAVSGECKWHNRRFGWDDLQQYIDHVTALGRATRVVPDALHLLFSKQGFDDRVMEWAASGRARLLTPADLLGPFQTDA